MTYDVRADLLTGDLVVDDHCDGLEFAGRREEEVETEMTGRLALREAPTRTM